MPQFHGMLERANSTFMRDNLRNIDPEDFNERRDLIDGMKTYGILRPGTKEREIMARMPRGIRAALRALIHANLTRAHDPACSDEEPFVMQWCWAPSVHYELQILAEIGPIQGSGGGITVVLKTPLPRSMPD
jgi:hypothetical protein